MKRFLTGSIVLVSILAGASMADAKRAITFNGTHLSGSTVANTAVTGIMLAVN